MKVSLNWLRQFVDVDDDAGAVRDRLTLGGLEVEAVETRGAELAHVVVAELASVAPHPNAERVSVCRVRVATDAEVTVVSGAPNLRPGSKVAYARVGANLASGTIASRDVRGVTSDGMLCSEAELGLSADASGIAILDGDAPVGARLGVYLGVEDTVLEVAVPPNRGDCLSILGIAREVAALSGRRLIRQSIRVRERGAPAADAIAIRIEPGSGCARYAARLVRAVRVGPSPGWMQARLTAAGIRPINNVVDVTNYVMLERGQPLHAFDYDRLPQREIVVRQAGATAALRTLDGVERTLVRDDLLITTGAEPIAIAGVMGGAATEVTNATTTVLLESAWFEPSKVRLTARRLALPSEAAYRFERGVDIAGVPLALDRAGMLLAEIHAGEIGSGIVDVYPDRREPAPIEVRLDRVGALLGMSVTSAEVNKTTKDLGMRTITRTRGVATVVPPTWRNDVTREVDVIEEVGRVLGYDRITPSMPAVALASGRMPERMQWSRELQRLLVARGLSEAALVSFTSPRHNQCFRGLNVAGETVEIRNPMSRDESELRRSLLGGLVSMLRLNRSYGSEAVSAFAIGKVYWRTDSPQEGWRLAAMIAGDVPEQGLGARRQADFADMKGIVESVLALLRVNGKVQWRREPPADTFHPGRSAVVALDTTVGVLGALHPELEAEWGVRERDWFFELDLDEVLAYVPPRLFYQELPRFPAVVRDVAIVTDEEFASDEVSRFVRGWGHAWVEDVVLFDQYIGAPIPAGRKSLAYSISYRASDRTLTDDEVNGVHAELTAALCSAFPIELRQ